MLDKVSEYMGELMEDELLDEVKAQIAAGATKLQVIEALQKGMETVGELFANKEYFVADLIASADLFTECVELFPEDNGGEEAKYGNFVIGTVFTDLHDVGKNIAAQLFKCNGFNVIDLGVDVQPETFIEAIKKYNPSVVGISCLLTTSFEPLKTAIAAIRDAGLADGRLIYIGGAPLDKRTCEYFNADAFFTDAQASVRYAMDYMAAKK